MRTTEAVTLTTPAAITATEPPISEPPPARYENSRIFIEEYGIDKDALFETGMAISGTEYERACAAAQTAQNLGGRNCIEYALNAYFIGEGAGLNICIARSAMYDWYGHVANAVEIDGAWYYMEPQGGLAGLAQTLANGYYPDGLDLLTDIYGNPFDAQIAEHPYN